MVYEWHENEPYASTARQPTGQCVVWLLAAGMVSAAVIGAEIHRIRWISATVLPILHQLAVRQQEYATTAEYATGIVVGANLAPHVPPRLRIVASGR